MFVNQFLRAHTRDSERNRECESEQARKREIDRVQNECKRDREVAS